MPGLWVRASPGANLFVIVAMLPNTRQSGNQPHWRWILSCFLAQRAGFLVSVGTWHFLTNNIMLKTGRPYLLEIQNQQASVAAPRHPILPFYLVYLIIFPLCTTSTYFPLLLSASPSTPSPYFSLPLLLLLPPTSLCLSFYSFPSTSLCLSFYSFPLLLSASPSTPSPYFSLPLLLLLPPPIRLSSCALPSPKAPFSPLLYPFLSPPGPPFIPWT